MEVLQAGKHILRISSILSVHKTFQLNRVLNMHFSSEASVPSKSLLLNMTECAFSTDDVYQKFSYSRHKGETWKYFGCTVLYLTNLMFCILSHIQFPSMFPFVRLLQNISERKEDEDLEESGNGLHHGK